MPEWPDQVRPDQVRPDQVVRQVADAVWRERAADAFERWHTPDFRNHTAAPGMDAGLAAFKRSQTGFLDAFGDAQLDILEQVVEGDRVASRIRMRGTHDGAFMGVPPTGRKVEVSGMRMDRIEGGRIAEHWAVIDLFGLMRQIAPVG